MKITVKDKSTGKSFQFPTMPQEITVETSNSYKKYNIIKKREYSIPSGVDSIVVSCSGRFFGKNRKSSALIQKWTSPDNCIKTLNKMRRQKHVLTLKVTGAGINIDCTISKFTYKPVGGFGDFEYTVEFIQYNKLSIYTTKDKSASKKKKKKGNRNSKPKKKVYTVKKNHTSKSGICAISKKYYGTTGKWTKIYNKNKTVIEKAAKKHKRKSSDKGRYLYKGTKLTIP